MDSFAHSVRDMDVDDEFVAMVQERPNVVLIPNLGGRGAHEDMSFLSGTLSGEALEAAQAQHMDRPEAHESFGIQARKPRPAERGRHEDRHGHRRQRGLAAPHRDARHGGVRDEPRTRSSSPPPAPAPST